eukprot:4191872-Amphidinium_carterae.1
MATITFLAHCHTQSPQGSDRPQLWARWRWHNYPHLPGCTGDCLPGTAESMFELPSTTLPQALRAASANLTFPIV